MYPIVVLLFDGLAGPLPLILESATGAGGVPPAGGREPFSLQFRGPATPILPQAIYRLESDVMEPLEIFLVPIAGNAIGVTYEAIFA